MAENEKSSNQNQKKEPGEMPLEEDAFESAPTHPKQVMVTDEELRNLQKEVLEYKDKYLRLLADVDNARKRLQKEKQEMTRYALESVILEFLRPIDNFENALSYAQEMSDEIRNWAFGFQMILTQFKDVLAQNGITAIDSMGKPFSPHDHEALEIVATTTYPPGVVIEECVKGYKMGDRTIRAARVKVSKTNEKNGSSQKNHSNEENI